MNIIIEDFLCYRHALLAQGFWATIFHRFGSLAHEPRPPVMWMPIRIIHRILMKVSEILFGIYIGPNVKLGRRVIIEHFGSIIIHSEAVIGDDVRIRQGVTIGNKSAQDPLGVPTICAGVDIGAGAKVLGRIVIGERARIGANAVVVRDVPAGVTVAGVPARIIKR